MDPSEPSVSNALKRGEKAELEVTGVSRSGRVRKKSSKLMDFESLDDPPKVKKPKSSPESPKKKPQSIRYIKFTLPPNTPTDSIDLKTLLQGKAFVNHIGPKITFINNKNQTILANSVLNNCSQTSVMSAETEDETSKENAQILELLNNELNNTNDDEEEEDEEGNLVINEEGTKAQSPALKSPKRTQKVFSKDVKNNKIAPTSPKPVRYTAYMLWSKDMRQTLLKSNPRMDFSAISKKLGELWAKVPSNERYNWSNRAKRETERCLLSQPKDVTFEEKKTPKRSPKKSAKVSARTPIVELSHLLVATKKCSANQTDSMEQQAIKDLARGTEFRNVEVNPIDVAAHLSLLGDSLMLIGDRLKEHSGQIAVSGSLSVLLDSLLCALGSLGCLTLQIPGIGDQNQEVMKRTLENIGYIMPGL